MYRMIRRVLALVAFAWGGCVSAGPITDTVVVDTVEWAQVDLFLGLAWSDINAECPGGVCGSGTLNGYDMAGWSWATVDDMNDLFNHYIGFVSLGPGSDTYYGSDRDFTVSAAFLADGWRHAGHFFGSSVVGPVTAGLVSDSSVTAPYIGALEFNPVFGPTGDRAGTDDLMRAHSGPEEVGIWFYREESTVAAPATISLVGSVLFGLWTTRRRKA